MLKILTKYVNIFNIKQLNKYHNDKEKKIMTVLNNESQRDLDRMMELCRRYGDALKMVDCHVAYETTPALGNGYVLDEIKTVAENNKTWDIECIKKGFLEYEKLLRKHTVVRKNTYTDSEGCTYNSLEYQF
jgi:hypothetical protein